jgi:hypothetical protein
MIEDLIIGQNDLKLAQTLIKAGGEHCKFLRMIQVWVDLTLPRFIWSEFDTYHYNTKNSCSTMHKLFDKQHILSSDDFELSDTSNVLSTTHNIETIHKLNILRERYFEANTQQEKNEILTIAKEILPESYLQKRTINTNYAELRNIYFQRRYHKLKCWHTICKWIEILPYSQELITLE